MNPCDLSLRSGFSINPEKNQVRRERKKELREGRSREQGSVIGLKTHVIIHFNAGSKEAESNQFSSKHTHTLCVADTQKKKPQWCKRKKQETKVATVCVCVSVN